MYTIKDNLLYEDDKQVRFEETPNKSSGTIIPKFLIQHYTAAINVDGTVSWFKTPDSVVSAHLVIGRDGEVIQFVKFNQKAWHAGKSSWQGIEGLNSFSIGIEMANAGRLTRVGDNYFFGKVQIDEEDVFKEPNKENYWHKYTDIQLETVKEISLLLTSHYNLLDVLGHSDIAPGRKTDPGPAFPIKDLKPVKKKTMAIALSNLNMRTGAGVEFKVIEVIPKNAPIEELSRQDGWSRINFQNRLGWVSNKYLK